MARVTIILVSWNSAYWLPDCLGSLRRQQFKDFSLQVVDNASQDRSIAVVREFFPPASVLSNFRNVGFCRAVNQGIRLARTEYVLLLNPDVVLEPTGLHKLVAFADAHPRAAAVGPKLLRHPSRGADDAEDGPPVAAPPLIDSAGMAMNRWRLPKNRGEGRPDSGERYGAPEQVFGVSGACALYRRLVLESVAHAGQYLDEDFFAYKEDADLAWRLRLAGYEIWYAPAAVAYHTRRVRQPVKVGQRWRLRRQVPRQLRVLSAKNQFLMVIKNEQGVNFWRDSVYLVAYAVAMVFLSLTVEPFLWRAWREGWRQLPAARRKRKVIQGFIRVSPPEMRKWFRTNN